jgi:hypothetical protein
MDFKNFLQENKLLVVVFVFALSLQAFFLVSLAYPVVPDIFERARVTDYLLSNGSIPSFDSLIAPNGIYYLYPPLVDLFLAIGSIIFFSSPIFVWKILSFLFFAFFLFFCLKFSGKYLSKSQQTLMVLFLTFAPIVLRRFVSYVAETVAFAFYPLLFYLIYKKKYWLAGIVLAVIGLTHFRSFFTSFAVVALFAFFCIIQKDKQNFLGSLKALVLAGVLVSPFYLLNLSKLFGISSFVNPFVGDNVFVALSFLGLPLLLFALLSIPFLKHSKFDSLFVSMIVVPLILLGSVLFSRKPFPFPYREAVFLALPLAILASFSFSKILGVLKKNYLKLLAFLALFFLFAFFFVVPQAAFSVDDEKTVSFLNANVSKGSLVLSDYVFGYWLEYSGYSIVAGPFIERLPDAEHRLFLLYDFFEGKNSEVLKEFSPKCIVFRNKAPKFELAGFEKVFVSGKNSVYCKK